MKAGLLLSIIGLTLFSVAGFAASTKGGPFKRRPGHKKMRAPGFPDLPLLRSSQQRLELVASETAARRKKSIANNIGNTHGQVGWSLLAPTQIDSRSPLQRKLEKVDPILSAVVQDFRNGDKLKIQVIINPEKMSEVDFSATVSEIARGIAQPFFLMDGYEPISHSWLSASGKPTQLIISFIVTNLSQLAPTIDLTAYDYVNTVTLAE